MNIPSVLELVKASAWTSFIRYQDRQLWYGCQSKGVGEPDYLFEFPVPIDDADGAVFLQEDKTIFFMRWIRKHVEMLTAASQEDA